MQTIAIVNEKGGTGKTTTAVSLAAALGEIGKSVLLVDLDGQAASSRWLGVENDTRLADAMLSGSGLEPLRNLLPGVSLAPGCGKLDSVAHELRPTQGGQLRKVISKLEEQFDYVLIDCPPSLSNRLIGNALLAATHALVPVEPSILSLDGLGILLTTLDDVRDGFNHQISLMGVVVCRYETRTRLSRQVMAELNRALPGKVFRSVIRETVRMQECPASGQSILTFAPISSAASDYRALAQEFVEVSNREELQEDECRLPVEANFRDVDWLTLPSIKRAVENESYGEKETSKSIDEGIKEDSPGTEVACPVLMAEESDLMEKAEETESVSSPLPEMTCGSSEDNSESPKPADEQESKTDENNLADKLDADLPYESDTASPTTEQLAAEVSSQIDEEPTEFELEDRQVLKQERKPDIKKSRLVKIGALLLIPILVVSVKMILKKAGIPNPTNAEMPVASTFRSVDEAKDPLTELADTAWQEDSDELGQATLDKGVSEKSAQMNSNDKVLAGKMPSDNITKASTEMPKPAIPVLAAAKGGEAPKPVTTEPDTEKPATSDDKTVQENSPVLSQGNLPPNLSCAGILNGPEGLVAIINGNVYKTGEKIGGADIVSIQSFAVQIEIDGEQITLGVGETYVAHTPAAQKED